MKILGPSEENLKKNSTKGQHQNMTEILYPYSVKIDGGRWSADIFL